MKRLLACVFVVAVMLGGPVANAVQPDEIMSDPAKEARARDLSRELRCMVCQNQSIDDSDAPLARDLRILVRDRLKAGGARVLGDGEPKMGAHGKPVLFLHPKDFLGTLVELEQA